MRYGVFTEYSGSIHGVFICIGYVSGMYRLCVGYVSEGMGSEGVNKEDNESNKHPCAGAQKSKLSKPKTRSVVDKEDNTNNHSVAPTLCHGEGKYLSTIKKQFRFNNGNNFDSTMETINILWRERKEI